NVQDDSCFPVTGGPLISLAIGAEDSTTFKCHYQVNQLDIDSGKVTNSAKVIAFDPKNNVVTDVSDDLNDPSTPGSEDPTNTLIPENPKLDLSKSSTFEDSNNDGAAQVGEKIKFRFVLKNTGNVTLRNVLINDIKCDPSQIADLPLLPAGANDAIYIWTCYYTLTRADVDRGSVPNQATISAESVRGTQLDAVSNDPTTPEPNDPTITPLVQKPVLELLKKSTLNDTNSNQIPEVGETILYNFTVSNKGNVTLTNVVVTDNKCSPVIGAPIAVFEVDATDSTTFSCVYTITQTDLDAGKIENSATTTGKGPLGQDVSDISDDLNDPSTPGVDDPTVTLLASNPSIELNKQSKYNDENGDSFGQVGETISYSFIVKNTGNVTLSNVSLSDDKCSPIVGGPINTFAPGSVDSTTFICSYTLTQADIDAGQIVNSATVNSTDPSGKPVSDISDDLNDPAVVGKDDPTITKIGTNPKIELQKGSKYIDSDSNSLQNAGDKILYNFTVLNSGNVTLSNITIQDNKCSPILGGPIASLAITVSDSSTFTCE
ncbi:MAG: DUF7507 domain-containing protein, partial [Patescibacteria group bacterium]